VSRRNVGFRLMDSVSCNGTLRDHRHKRVFNQDDILDSASWNGTLGDHRHRRVFNQDAVLDSASCTFGDRRRVFNQDNVSRRKVGFGLMDVSRRNLGFRLMDSVGAILPTNKLKRTYRNN
jgi:hypothetical protein